MKKYDDEEKVSYKEREEEGEGDGEGMNQWRDRMIPQELLLSLHCSSLSPFVLLF
jgi:hypothetical protein